MKLALPQRNLNSNSTGEETYAIPSYCWVCVFYGALSLILAQACCLPNSNTDLTG